MPITPVPPRLDALLRQVLPDIAPDAVIGVDEPLSGHGLDSLAMVRLALRMEDEYAVSFPDEALVPETFTTATTLLRVVDGLLGAGTVAP
jgi:acyl carrier protein